MTVQGLPRRRHVVLRSDRRFALVAAERKTGDHSGSDHPWLLPNGLDQAIDDVKLAVLELPLDGQSSGQGWMKYFGCFYRSALYPLLHRINTYLVRWIQKKNRAGMKQALRRLADGPSRRPTYFAHWTWVTPAGTRTRTTRAV